ncbi:unnamed protein product [Bursaphelenchus okinawaensis]|uniref:Uncharacterized protein n=1 Tax=Bursaphelenchus okinawaensis TaxID=465554 RepID=A0A811KBV9_9BILA|nr:unnamed protein product [Bursaphelenchus okinawaensis]CAG9097968.1 unnamed protein product [Bursaphelenchus okinawaensis]
MYENVGNPNSIPPAGPGGYVGTPQQPPPPPAPQSMAAIPPPIGVSFMSKLDESSSVVVPSIQDTNGWKRPLKPSERRPNNKAKLIKYVSLTVFLLSGIVLLTIMGLLVGQ